MDDNNNYGTGNVQNNDNPNQYQQQNQMNNQNSNQQQPQDYQYNNQQQDYQQNNQQQYQYHYNGQPMYQPPYYDQQPNGNNGMAIGALICGIISILINCCFAWFISLPTAIAGIILGIMAIKNNKPGRTMAIVGLILSSIGALLGIIVLIGCAIVSSNRSLFNDIYKQFQWEFDNYYY